MTRRRLVQPVLALALGGLLALPAPGWGASGSAALGGDPPATTPRVATARGTDGSTLSARAGTLVRHRVRLHGTTPRRRPLDVQARRGRGRWSTVASVRPAADGGWAVRVTPRHLGRYSFRALPSGTSAAAAATAARVHITVYLAAVATWYGPGLYGRVTACGVRLTPTTLGVAHRTLPCGTEVSLLYHGRAITVPVIDRGPYSYGVQWDLTAATADVLATPGRATIGAVSLRGNR
jgi:rare lipoprotein A